MSAASLEGKIALVTGGSRGIGRSICVELASRGAHVLVNYRSGEDAAKETVGLCEKAGGKAEAVGFDIADAEAVEKAVKQILADHKRLDILVNNAGVNKDQLLIRTSLDDWNSIIGTNLGGTFYMLKTVGRAMMKQRGGSIVNISSVVGRSGNIGQTAYSASKAGILGMTKSIAKELGSRNVRVNAVCPGFIETEMTGDLVEGAGEELIKNIPLGRIGKPEEIAGTVAFLAGEDAAYITGAVLDVNGGLYM